VTAEEPVRYFVLASDELMASDPQWPACLRPVGPVPGVRADPGMNWWLFEDDEAPPALSGKKVGLTVERADGAPRITDRVVTGK